MKTMIAVHGMAVLMANIAKRSAAVNAEAAQGINRTAEKIFRDSQAAVPVDTGNLKGSARLNPATPGELRAVVEYGGTAAGYALAVHETHKSRSKYLENPAKAATAFALDAVKVAIRKAIE